MSKEANVPYWYRRQEYEHKLSSVLNNPLTDIKDYTAARVAIKKELGEYVDPQAKVNWDKVKKYRSEL